MKNKVDFCFSHAVSLSSLTGNLLQYIVSGISYFKDRQNRSTTMLSKALLTPSMLIRIPCDSNTDTKASEVNWLPWSVV